jgi:hypothetical protein
MSTTPEREVDPLTESRQRYRLTIRGDDPVIELRGYIDGWMELNHLCRGLSDQFGKRVMVIASIVEDEYDPEAR